MPPLSKRAIWSALSGIESGAFGANVHYFEQATSTNDVARKMAEEHAPEGTLVFADEQTAGRGRMGRRWEAPPETNLLMSVIFRPVIAPDEVNRLVIACGLAVCEACERATKVKVDVKWPNDLLIGEKKVAGILPESSMVGAQLSWVVVGMGVNVNQPFSESDSLSAQATSLYMETGKTFDRALLLAQVMARLNAWYTRLSSVDLLDAWRSRCVTLGSRIQVDAAGRALSGVAESLDPTGALLLRDDMGERHRLVSGEVTLHHR